MSTQLTHRRLCAVVYPRLKYHQNLHSSLRFRQAIKCSWSSHEFSSLTVPTAVSIGGFWSSLWESVLKAVPKKKTSHSKKRSRQLAGKALKDVRSLNQCSACGRIKKMHFLCPHCVQNIKDIWAGRTIIPKDTKENR